MDNQISKEAWIDWKQNEVTKFFLTAINTKREILKEGIAEGHTGNEYDQYVGRCMGIKDCLDYALIYEDKEIEENAEGSGV